MEIQYSEKAKFFKPNIFNILNERKAKIAQKGVKVYDLFVGTPDFPPAEHVMKVGDSSKIEKITAVLHGYPPYLNRKATTRIFETIQEKDISIVYIDNSISGQLIKKIK